MVKKTFFVLVNFSSTIINWYSKHKRDLPWRNTKDPYAIWLSEIILQQTKVAQGLPYYLKFMEAFPTVEDLANADESYVLKLWQGLGYYNRARNLQFTAKDITNNYSKKFPSTFEGLKQLKGVGDYTAAAIASFCYQEKTPVVDGNVYRVLSRYYGDSTPINTGAGQRTFRAYAEELIPEANPDTFNQAIMEFGALQCTPKKPNCDECPLQTTCEAFDKKSVAELPVKKGKVKVKPLHITFFVLADAKKLIFKKRPSKGIWADMYDFPSIEREVPFAMEESIAYLSQNILLEKKAKVSVLNRTELKHKLSHKNIVAEFLEIDVTNIDLKEFNAPTLVSNPKDIAKAIPRLIELYLQESNRI